MRLEDHVEQQALRKKKKSDSGGAPKKTKIEDERIVIRQQLCEWGDDE